MLKVKRSKVNLGLTQFSTDLFISFRQSLYSFFCSLGLHDCNYFLSYYLGLLHFDSCLFSILDFYPILECLLT